MAVSFIGASNLIATNGGAPGAITVHANTVNGHLLVWYHYSRATGGNETVSFPAGWNTVFNSVTANNGLVAVAWRIRTAGDTTYTATITNHTSGNSGETVLQHIETYAGADATTPIPNFTASLSTWASSLTVGSIAAPGTATVNDGDMVVVFGGRFENITAQTVLTGDSLTWANRTLNDSTLGLDAAYVTQNGLNSSGSNQTVTAKSITTTGTAGAGAGRMFIIEQSVGTVHNVSITENASATDTQSATVTTSATATENTTASDSQSAGLSISVSVTENASATESQSAKRYLKPPQVVGSIVLTETLASTSHVVNLPSGIQAGEQLVIFASTESTGLSSASTPFTLRWGNTNNGGVAGSTFIGLAYGARYCDGTEGSTLTIPSSVATNARFVAFRVEAGARILQWDRATSGVSQSICGAESYRSGHSDGLYNLLSVLAYKTGGEPSAPITDFTLVSDATPISGGSGVYVNRIEKFITAHTEFNPASAYNQSACYWAENNLALYWPPNEEEGTNWITEPYGTGSRTQGGHSPLTTSGHILESAVIEKFSQSFLGNGHKIRRVGTVFSYVTAFDAQHTLDVTLKIYAHSGTYGTSSVPTGTALATSETINLSQLFDTTCNQLYWFHFDTPYDTAVDEQLCMVLEATNFTTGHKATLRISGAEADTGNPAIYNGTTWTSPSGSNALALIYEYELTGSTYNETATENTSATESQSATKDVSATATETASSTETQTATRDGAVSATESTSSTETQTATRNGVVTATENTSATDTQSATRTFAVTATENTSSTDTQSAARTGVVTATENTSSTETQSATRTFAVTATENTTASESSSGEVTGGTVHNESITENTSSTESQSATRIGVVTATENTSSTETQSATRNGVVTATENTSSTESQSATRVLGGTITESASAGDTQSAIRTLGATITENATATESQSGTVTGSYNVPLILGTTKGTSTVNATSHTATYPTGVLMGELLILAISSNGSSLSSPSGWRGTSKTSGSLVTRVCYRYANGEEEKGDFTITTSGSEKISWIILRISKGAVINHHHFTTGTGSYSPTCASFRSGDLAKDYSLINIVHTYLDAVPAEASVDYTAIESQAGHALDGASVFVQQKSITSTPNTTETPSAVSIGDPYDYVTRTLSLTFDKAGNRISRQWLDHGDSGVDLNSTTPTKGVSQSFIGDGARIERIGVNMRRSGTVTGTLSLKIYELSGTYSDEGFAVPTGAVLASANTTINPANFSTTVWQYEEFVFNTPFRTVVNKAYAFTVECSDISGGNIRVARASSTTGFGNSATSADLVTWSVVSPDTKDIVHFIQTVEGDTPFIFRNAFHRATMPDNNTLNGLEALELVDFVDSVRTTSASPTYVTQSIVDVDGRKAFYGRPINDDPGTVTLERAQISVNYWDQAEQPAVFHYRTKMKFGPDFEFLRQRTNGIGTGYPDWIDFWETWLHINPAWDGDTAGAARWNLNLLKASGTNQPYTWKLKGEFMQPEAVHYNDMWSATNSSVPVQLDKWFYLDVYMKVGEFTNGRTIVKIKYEGEEEITLFDVNDTTLYYEGEPTIKVGSWNPSKVYTSDAVMDYMYANGKKFEQWVEEIVVYDGTITHIEEDNYGGATDSVTATLSLAISLEENENTTYDEQSAEVIPPAAVINVSISEKVTTAYANQTAFNSSAFATETASATDSQTAIRISGSDISEMASASDSASALRVRSVSLAELASATATQGYTSIHNVSISELTSASESSFVPTPAEGAYVPVVTHPTLKKILRVLKINGINTKRVS